MENFLASEETKNVEALPVGIGKDEYRLQWAKEAFWQVLSGEHFAKCHCPVSFWRWA